MADEEIALEVKSETVTPDIEKAWAAVFKVVNAVISHHDRFGFKLIESHINPSLTDILRALKALDTMLNLIQAENNLEYEGFRLLVNAKQQIVNFELVVSALKYDQQDDYEKAMLNLRTQVQF